MPFGGGRPTPKNKLGVRARAWHPCPRDRERTSEAKAPEFRTMHQEDPVALVSPQPESGKTADSAPLDQIHEKPEAEEAEP